MFIEKSGEIRDWRISVAFCLAERLFKGLDSSEFVVKGSSLLEEVLVLLRLDTFKSKIQS